jgi:hypothetical protein
MRRKQLFAPIVTYVTRSPWTTQAPRQITPGRVYRSLPETRVPWPPKPRAVNVAVSPSDQPTVARSVVPERKQLTVTVTSTVTGAGSPEAVQKRRAARRLNDLFAGKL